MSTGRTLKRWARVYCDGVDLSGFCSEIGPLETTFDEAELLAVSDGVRGVLPNTPNISIGTLNAVYDNTATSGLQAVMGGAGVTRDVLVALGIRAAPAEGDPCFMGVWNQLGFTMVPGVAVTATIPIGMWDINAGPDYSKAWGTFLHTNDAATGLNTGTGVDGGAATAAGGWMMYHITAVAGTGTVAIKVQDSTEAVNGSFGDITDATSGAIAHTAVPASGIIQLGTTAAIKQFLCTQFLFVARTASVTIIV